MLAGMVISLLLLPCWHPGLMHCNNGRAPETNQMQDHVQHPVAPLAQRTLNLSLKMTLVYVLEVCAEALFEARLDSSGGADDLLLLELPSAPSSLAEAGDRGSNEPLPLAEPL